MMAGRVLAVEGVSKGYSRDGRWSGVLSDVSLQVMPGEIVAVLGRRLAGKSTVLQIAAGMQRPDEGRVVLGDVDLAGLSDRQRSRLLGRDVVWLDRNGPGLNVEVGRFVGLSLALHGRGRREARRLAAEMLGRVGARECISLNPPIGWLRGCEMGAAA
jgi:ABC-type glutathione transport system ATPase component